MSDTKDNKTPQNTGGGISLKKYRDLEERNKQLEQEIEQLKSNSSLQIQRAKVALVTQNLAQQYAEGDNPISPDFIIEMVEHAIEGKEIMEPQPNQFQVKMGDDKIKTLEEIADEVYESTGLRQHSSNRNTSVSRNNERRIEQKSGVNSLHGSDSFDKSVEHLKKLTANLKNRLS